MKTRKIVYQSIWKQKLTYGIKCLVNFNTYRKYMEGVIYRLIKKCFGIRGNPKKSQVSEFFNVNLNEITMEQLPKLRKICKNYNSKKFNEINIKSNCSVDLLNFIFERLLQGYKGQKLCKCNSELSFRHLTDDCELLEEWRRESKYKLRENSTEDIINRIHNWAKRGTSTEVDTANEVVSIFYSTLLENKIGIRK